MGRNQKPKPNQIHLTFKTPPQVPSTKGDDSGVPLSAHSPLSRVPVALNCDWKKRAGFIDAPNAMQYDGTDLSTDACFFFKWGEGGGLEARILTTQFAVRRSMRRRTLKNMQCKLIESSIGTWRRRRSNEGKGRCTT